jgi:antirestriction protein ArdC
LCTSSSTRSCELTATTAIPSFERAAEELVIETVAYSVCASSGIDPGEFSISYLAGWSEQTPIATIKRTAALIDRLSRRIEDAVHSVTITDAGAAAGASATVGHGSGHRLSDAAAMEPVSD